MKIGMTPERRVQLKIDGGYDKHGDVFVIARPLTGSVSFPVKTFDDAKAREQFIEEFTFFRYGGQCPSWDSVLFANDCFSGEEKYSDTLKGESYTPDRGKAYVTQLIASGELVVHCAGSWIPPGDRNHHLPWPTKPKEKEEILPVVDHGSYALGPHDGPGSEHPEKPEPQVSIAEAPLVEWTIPESGESDSIVLHAVGTPSGGTYAWTGVDKKVCSLSTSSTGQNIEIKPIGEGSFKAFVSYDFQGKVAKDIVEVKVGVVPDKVRFDEFGSVTVSGRRPIDRAKSYESGIRDLYGEEVPLSQRTYFAPHNKSGIGYADNVASINGRQVAIEAKYTDDWENSIFNPESSKGQLPWAAPERARMINQAKNYNSTFDDIIYHTNSAELATYYSQLLKDSGISNFKFVITPVGK